MTTWSKDTKNASSWSPSTVLWYGGHPDPVDWLYRAKIKIDKTKVAGSLTDYRFFIDLALLPAGFWSKVQNGGGDIRLTTADGYTELAREVVSCDTATKKGEVHVLLPSLSNVTDTYIYLYFGNPSASDYAANHTYGRYAVWGNNAKFVGHFQGNFNDSSSNNNHGSNRGSTWSTQSISTANGYLLMGGEYETISYLVENNTIAFGKATGNVRIAQKFNTNEGIYNLNFLKSVRVLRAASTGIPASTIRINIYTDNAGVPGTLVGGVGQSGGSTGQWESNSTTADSFLYHDCALTLNTNYWLVFLVDTPSDTGYPNLRYNSSYANDGTFKVFDGTTWVSTAGRLKYALQQGDDVALTNGVSLTYNNFSISFRMAHLPNIDSGLYEYETIFSKIRGGGEGYICIGQQTNALGIESSTNNIWQRNTPAISSLNTSQWNGTINWKHVVFVSSASGAYFYVDGTKYAFSGNIDTANQVYQYIGSKQGWAYIYGKAFSGYLDEIRMFNNTVLTDADIATDVNNAMAPSTFFSVAIEGWNKESKHTASWNKGSKSSPSWNKAGDSGLIGGELAWYQFNETSGTTIYDSSGNGNNGTIGVSAYGYYPLDGNTNAYNNSGTNLTNNGASPTTDMFGNANSAYEFTAVGQYISGVLNTSNVRFVAIRYKANDITIAAQTIFGSNNGAFQWFKQAANNWTLYFYDSVTGLKYNYQPVNPANDGQWHLDSFGFDVASHTVSWYRDGVSKGTLTAFATYSSVAPTTFFLGNSPTEGLATNYFRGAVDEVFLYQYNPPVQAVTRYHQINLAHDLNKPFVAGKRGGAYEMWGHDALASNGGGSFGMFYTNISNVIKAQSPWAISVWYYVSSTYGGAPSIGWYGGNYKGPYFNVYAGAVGMAVGQGTTKGSNSNWNGSTPAGSITYNQWNHIVVQYTGTYIDVYINSNLVYTYNIGAYVDNGNGGQNFKINSNPWDYNRLGCAAYEDLRVFKRALNQEEVTRLYRMPVNVTWTKEPKH